MVETMAGAGDLEDLAGDHEIGLLAVQPAFVNKYSNRTMVTTKTHIAGLAGVAGTRLLGNRLTE
ncbi:hypothetical protein MRX96_046327, partial [Rhipicephalus microplus]